MTAYPIPNPFSQWVGITGLPLTGAKIYIGQPNQDPETHPIAVYQDAALTIGLAQPIRTNGGYVSGTGTPVNAYPSSTPYSIRVRTSAGVEVFYKAEVHDELAEFVALLTGANGSNLLGFRQNGTGAVDTNVGAVLREVAFTLSEFGGGTGVADNTDAFNKMFAAIKANGGGRSFIAPGNYNVSSTSLAAAIVGCSNVDCFWEGVTVTVSGTGQTAGLFNFDGCSNVAFYGRPKFVGNSKSTGYNNGYAISAILPDTATADMASLRFDVDLDNFAAPWWCVVQNNNATYAIRNVGGHVRFTSRSGNSIQPTMLSYNAAAVKVDGYAGFIYDVDFTVTGDANYIKSGVIYFSRVVGGSLRADVANAGVAGATDNAGAYAVLIYENTNELSNIQVYARCANPRSIGVYVAGCVDVCLIDPDVFGQTDTDTSLLPKAGIVFNGTTRPQIIGGQSHDNFTDLFLVGPQIGTNAEGRFSDFVTWGSKKALATLPFPTRNTQGYYFSNCGLAATPEAGGRVIGIQNTASFHIDNIVFDGGYIRNDGPLGTSLAVDLYVVTGSAATGYKFRDMSITGRVYAQDMTGTLAFQNCEMLGDPGAAKTHTQLINCAKVEFDNLTYRDITVGYCIDTPTCLGTQTGLQFPGSPNHTVDGASMGASAPTFAGSAGDIVQNLYGTAYVPQGAALSKFTIPEYVCETGSTWWERRCLTGT